MSNFLRNQKGNTKGIAQFTAAVQSAFTGPANLNAFTTQVFNNSTGIIKTSDTQVTLKAGKVYRIVCNCNAEAYNDVTIGFVEFQLHIDGVSKAIHQEASAMVTNVTINFQRSGPLQHVHHAVTDSVLTIRGQALNGSATVNSGSPNCIIEELEEFIPQSAGNTLITGDLQVTGGIKLPGTVPAAGFVGEGTAATEVTVTTASAAWRGSAAVLTLTTGVWEIIAYARQAGASLTANIAVTLATNNNNDSSGSIIAGTSWETFAPATEGSAGLAWQRGLTPISYTVVGSATIYAKVYASAGTNNAIIGVRARRIS